MTAAVICIDESPSEEFEDFGLIVEGSAVVVFAMRLAE